MVVYHKPLPPTPKWGTYLRRSAADGIQKEALNQVASDKKKKLPPWGFEPRSTSASSLDQLIFSGWFNPLAETSALKPWPIKPTFLCDYTKKYM